MSSENRNDVMSKKRNQNIRAKVRKGNLHMSGKRGNNSNVQQLENGKFRLVSPTECDESYTDQVLKLVEFAYPKSINVKDLKGMTTYQNITQFKTGFIQKLHDQGLVCYDADTCEVLITPLGRYYVYERGLVTY